MSHYEGEICRHTPFRIDFKERSEQDTLIKYKSRAIFSMQILRLPYGRLEYI